MGAAFALDVVVRGSPTDLMKPECSCWFAVIFEVQCSSEVSSGEEVAVPASRRYAVEFLGVAEGAAERS